MQTVSLRFAIPSYFAHHAPASFGKSTLLTPGILYCA